MARRRQKKTERPTHEEVQAHIEAMADANGGLITPAEIVDHATDPDSPLHSFFEWDDTAAAAKYRLAQASKLIRSCRIVFRTEKRKVTAVAYVRNPEAGPKEAGYIQVQRVKNDADMAQDVLNQEFIRARSAMERARRLAHYFHLEDEIDDFISGLDAMRQRTHSSEGVNLNA